MNSEVIGMQKLDILYFIFLKLDESFDNVLLLYYTDLYIKNLDTIIILNFTLPKFLNNTQ